ncbi:MAG: diguanylate cyclase [Bacilli bacterium]|nr:diguanylate cyclase [Bacilli bacterium]
MSQLAYYFEVNIICIVIILILVITQIKNIRSNTKSALYFSLLISTMFFSFFDIASILVRGQTFTGARELVYFFNIMFTVSMVVIAFLWIWYCISTLKIKKHKTFMIAVATLTAIILIFNITDPLHGLIFTVDSNNLYVRGSYLWINWAYVLVAAIVPIAFSVKADISKNEKIAIYLYPVAPIVAAVLQALFYGITTGQVGVTISLLIVYIVVQRTEADEQKLKIKVFDDMCNTDVLTGLNNRRAFIDGIESRKKRNWVGCVFLDINGLKKANDEKGHEAGDELIKMLSNTLTEVFPKNDVYRISGDEFVVLTTDKATFNFKVEEFKDRNSEMSSLGYVSGPGSEIENLLKQAESEMYKDKSDYYIRTGLDRRKNG